MDSRLKSILGIRAEQSRSICKKHAKHLGRLQNITIIFCSPLRSSGPKWVGLRETGINVQSLLDSHFHYMILVISEDSRPGHIEGPYHIRQRGHCWTMNNYARRLLFLLVIAKKKHFAISFFCV